MGGATRAREIILARRRFLIASAAASLAVSACDSRSNVCLNIAVPTPSSTEPAQSASAAPSASAPAPAPPRVCLNVSTPRPEPSTK